MTTNTDLGDTLAHFPQTVGEGIVEYARDVVFLHSRYLFVRREGKYQFGYCTHCKQEYVSGIGGWYLKHNEPFKCLSCGSQCIVKASGRGRKSLIDEAYFVYYEKSVIDPNSIVARGLHVIRDYSGDYTRIETMFRPVAMYLFQPGRTAMLHTNWQSDWYKRKAVSSEFYTSMKYKACYVSHGSITSAVQGTSFQYFPWERFTDVSADLVTFFGLAAKYPCVEYLAKLGMRDLVEAKLHGMHMYRAVNWRGTSLNKVLKLTKFEIKDARSSGVRITPLVLHSFHFFKRIGMPLSFQEAYLMGGLSEGYYLKEARDLREYATFTDICRYILKQLAKETVSKHYRSGSSVLTTWRDYIRDCKELGMDLQKEHVLFPNNIYNAHQKTMEKVRIKQDEALNDLIAARLESLQKYRFVFGGLFIRPAQDSIELFKEGKALNHCVGRYAKTYAEGKTNLFVIRRVAEPETPFYTMEIIDNRITQTRGKNNCAPTDEVAAFVEAFTKSRLTKRNSNRVTETQAARPV